MALFRVETNVHTYLGTSMDVGSETVQIHGMYSSRQRLWSENLRQLTQYIIQRIVQKLLYIV